MRYGENVKRAQEAGPVSEGLESEENLHARYNALIKIDVS